MRLAQLVVALTQNGTLALATTTPRAQFGLGSRNYLGAQLLPERRITSPENIVRVSQFILRSVMANDQPRYAPTTKKSSASAARAVVSLATQGTKVDLTAEDVDILSQLTGELLTMQDGARVVDLLNVGVIIPLVERIEYHRWRCLVNAQVTLAGDNMYREVVNYTNPSGSRVTIAPNAWAGSTYDALADYMARIQYLRTNGMEPRRSITSSTMLAKFLANVKVQSAMGDIVLQGGTLTLASAMASIGRLNAYFAANNLPPVEVYDLMYRTQTGTGRFLPVDAWVVTGATGTNENVDLGDSTRELLEDTLGYVGVGTVAGQGAPGRWSRLTVREEYPPTVEAEGVQETLPILTQPLGVTVMQGG